MRAVSIDYERLAVLTRLHGRALPALRGTCHFYPTAIFRKAARKSRALVVPYSTHDGSGGASRRRYYVAPRQALNTLQPSRTSYVVNLKHVYPFYTSASAARFFMFFFERSTVPNDSSSVDTGTICIVCHLNPTFKGNDRLLRDFGCSIVMTPISRSLSAFGACQMNEFVLCSLKARAYRIFSSSDT